MSKSATENRIPYGRHHITEDDIQAVVQVLGSDFLTQGPKIDEFESAFAEYVGARYAVAVSNGTAALHLSAIALGVEPGQKVITTPLTFAATANCIAYSGGEVVFADIDPETYLLDIDKVRELLRSSPTGTYKGIIPVDFAGRPVNMETFRQLANEFGLWIIEDACHAPGGYFIDSNGDEQACGNGKYANLSIFSFHPVKHIAAGEGGMITTNDKKLYYRLLQLRTHGITRNQKEFLNSQELASGFSENSSSMGSLNFPNWYMEMQHLGFNYRLTDIQAALGLSQLQRANNGMVRRREIAETYFEEFKGKDFIIRQSGVIEGHAYHLYVLEIKNRKRLYDYLISKNIYCQVHYIPAHLMPYYKNLGWQWGQMSVAERYYSRCISIPMYPGLTKGMQEFVIDAILKFYQ